jgi:hypothetical protein
MADVLGDDACKLHCYSPTITVRLFAENGRSSRSAWPQTATCEAEQFLHYRRNRPIETRAISS